MAGLIFLGTYALWLIYCFKSSSFTPAINALKQSLEAIKRDEINFHKKKINDFDVDQAEAITSRFIQKITIKKVLW